MFLSSFLIMDSYLLAVSGQLWETAEGLYDSPAEVPQRECLSLSFYKNVSVEI